MMKRVTVEVAGFRLHSGDIAGLTPHQVRLREHKLRVLEQHSEYWLVQVLAPIEFKAGELVRLKEIPSQAPSETSEQPRRQQLSEGI